MRWPRSDAPVRGATGKCRVWLDGTSVYGDARPDVHLYLRHGVPRADHPIDA